MDALRVVIYTLMSAISAIAAMTGGGLLGHEHSVRWNVKTLGDGFVIPSYPISTTISAQLALPSTAVAEDTYRLPSERTLYVLKTRLVEAMLESDNDYHLVLEDPTTHQQMIAEIPEGVSTTPEAYRTLFHSARHSIDSLLGPLSSWPIRFSKPPMLQITGIGFFDETHLVPPPGTAPNGREIHPVIGVRVP